MMKMKKKREDETITTENQNKTTDNKENNESQEINGNNPGSASENKSENQPADNGTAADTKTDNNVAAVRAAEEKLAEMQDKYIRLSAEFDNYRKRTLREKMDLSKYASENTLVGLLPLMDDFERAMTHLDTATDSEAMKNGITLIYGKFSEFLKQNGVKEIDSANSPFNVDLHEAIAKVPVEDTDKKGKVMDVVQKGYYLQDKIIRFAKVVVGE
jgi:molecular chaperone GrpE